MPRRRKPTEKQAQASLVEITQIIKKIDDQELAMGPLFERMDLDNSDWRRDPYIPDPGSGILQRDAYTTNESYTLVERAKTVLSNAIRLHRIINESEPVEERNANNDAERLSIGFYKMADDRCRARFGVGVQEMLSHFSLLRGGWVTARALLLKDEDGDTVPEIVPFDPRHVIIETDANGPIMGAVIDERARGQIKQEYPNFVFDDADPDDPDAGRIRVIDYYTREPVTKESSESDGDPVVRKFRWLNGVIIDMKWAKELTPTTAVDPVLVARANGGNPGMGNYTLKSADTEKKEIAGIKDFSESILAANRSINRSMNRMMTSVQALITRRVQGVYKFTSRLGDASLVYNPNEPNQTIPLSSDDKQELELLPIAEAATADGQAMLGVISVDQASGDFGQNRGQLPSGASGRAIRISERLTRDILAPYEMTVGSIIEASLEGMLKQYETGNFEPIRVSGVSRGGEDFNREITPDSIKGRGPLTLKLLPILPEDDEGNMQMAILAGQSTATGGPTLDPRTILDNYLKVQDSDLVQRRIFASMARTSTPMMLAITQLEAAEEREDAESVAFFEDEIRVLLEEREMEQFARRFVFANQFGGGPQQVQAAADGVRQNGAGGGGQGTPRRPAANMQPETMPLSGTLLGGGGFRTDPEAQDVFDRTGLVIAER